MPQNFIRVTLHNIGQKFLADKGNKGKVDYWTYQTLATALKPKVEMYVKEYKHRVGILKGTPRAAQDQEQVVGLFRTSDAGVSFNNQEAAPVKIPLTFTEEHVTMYDAASAQLAASMAKLTGDKLVKQLVALCLCEIKFMFGCCVPWDKIPVAGQSASANQGSEPASVAASRSPSPKPKLTQAPSPKQKLSQAPSRAQALSSGGEEDDDGDKHENSDAYGSGTIR